MQRETSSETVPVFILVRLFFPFVLMRNLSDLIIETFVYLTAVVIFGKYWGCKTTIPTTTVKTLISAIFSCCLPITTFVKRGGVRAPVEKYFRKNALWRNKTFSGRYCWLRPNTPPYWASSPLLGFGPPSRNFCTPSISYVY